MTTPATKWLSHPYYVPDRADERVEAGAFFGSKPTAEAMLQVNAEELLRYPSGPICFLFPMEGSSIETPERLTKGFLDYANILAGLGAQDSFTGASTTAKGFNPDERGKFYADLVIETLKKIQASSLNPMEPSNLSVYDVWIRNGAR